MPETSRTEIAVVGIDIGTNSFHVIGLDQRGAIVLRQKWSRGQVRLSHPLPICDRAWLAWKPVSGRIISVVGFEPSGHNARLMPAKYVRPYSKGQKSDFRDAEAIARQFDRPARAQKHAMR